MDLACAKCAALWQGLDTVEIASCFRHFPLQTGHPGSTALHQAAEAAGAQGAFWAFVDRIFADRGRIDDPHLWSLVEQLGLDLDQFQADRRSQTVADRVERDFRSGVRAGVSGTPACFVDGQLIEPPVHRNLRKLLHD